MNEIFEPDQLIERESIDVECENKLGFVALCASCPLVSLFGACPKEIVNNSEQLVVNDAELFEVDVLQMNGFEVDGSSDQFAGSKDLSPIVLVDTPKPQEARVMIKESPQPKQKTVQKQTADKVKIEKVVQKQPAPTYLEQLLDDTIPVVVATAFRPTTPQEIPPNPVAVPELKPEPKPKPEPEPSPVPVVLPLPTPEIMPEQEFEPMLMQEPGAVLVSEKVDLPVVQVEEPPAEIEPLSRTGVEEPLLAVEQDTAPRLQLIIEPTSSGEPVVSVEYVTAPILESDAELPIELHEQEVPHLTIISTEDEATAVPVPIEDAPQIFEQYSDQALESVNENIQNKPDDEQPVYQKEQYSSPVILSDTLQVAQDTPEVLTQTTSDEVPSVLRSVMLLLGSFVLKILL